MHFMGKCEFCGEEVLLPFECSFCRKHFCNEHRLPENHDCIEAPRRTPLGPWHAKKSQKAKLIKIPSKKSVVSEGTRTGKSWFFSCSYHRTLSLESSNNYFNNSEPSVSSILYQDNCLGWTTSNI
jgi:hypothetical protein